MKRNNGMESTIMGIIFILVLVVCLFAEYIANLLVGVMK
jgi:ABC-type lipoprotein release transport system permease subunit